MLNTKHLKVFAAVARCGSVTHAASQLQRAQSAVSRSVKELENTLGVPLFERYGRGLLMTEYGRVLQRRTELAFGEMHKAQRLLIQQPSESPRMSSAPIFTLSVHERHLRALCALEETRRIESVAAAVGVTQPAISMALRDLEESVGVSLIDRSHAQIRLSTSGELLLLHVRRALTQLRIAREEIAKLQGVLQGVVTVGALPYGRPYILPAAIGKLVQAHPQIRIATVEGSLDSLVAALRSGQIDLIFGALPTADKHAELVREELFEESMALIARPHHPALQSGSLTLASVLQQNWVLPARGTPTRDVLESAVSRAGLRVPQVAVESSDLSIIRGLLLETNMISAASRHLFHHELQHGLLVELPLHLTETSRPIGILRRTPEHSSPIAQLLISELRAVRKPEPNAHTSATP